MAHAGSWFGLPDFGVTEKLGSLLSGGGTTDLSNAATQNYQQPLASPVSSGPTYGSGGSVQLGTPQPSVKGLSTSVAGTQPQQQQGPNTFDQAAGQAQTQAQIDLQNALNQFDYYSQQAQGQLTDLGNQKTSAENTMNTAYGQSQNQANQQLSSAQQGTQTAKAKALSTAQDVQKQNRNVLRALGILSSSAAGEMLNKPMNQYGTQAADLEQQLIQRKNVVGDWLNQQTTSHQQAMDDLQKQYASLVGNIQNDLRFNDKQRITAVQAANNALQTRLTEIQNSAQQYQQAAQQYNANIMGQIAQLKLYQNPGADVSGILSSLINTTQPAYTGGQASVYTGTTGDINKKNNVLSG